MNSKISYYSETQNSPSVSNVIDHVKAAAALALGTILPNSYFYGTLTGGTYCAEHITSRFNLDIASLCVVLDSLKSAFECWSIYCS